MNRILLLVFAIIVQSQSDGILLQTNPTVSDNLDENRLVPEEWDNPEYPHTQQPGENEEDEEELSLIQKRSPVDPLMRRSALDKNFMRFGRSGFFPDENSSKLKNLMRYTRNGPPEDDRIILINRNPSSNFVRFGRGSQDNFMRFGRAQKDNFIRFGRGAKDNFMRFGRGTQDNFMRFGRGIQDNFMRFGRGTQDNFMRFGRGTQDNFMRFGRGTHDNFMRFGRGTQDNFMRFGKGANDNFMRFGKSSKDNFIRFGKDDKNFMRFGRDDMDESDENDLFLRLEKSSPNFLRFGKSPKSNSFVRFGKSAGKTDQFIRFGKSGNSREGRNSTSFLRFGRNDIDGSKDSSDSDIEDSMDSDVEIGDLELRGDKFKNGPVMRIKRSANDEYDRYYRMTKSNHDSNFIRYGRDAEIMEEIPKLRNNEPNEENTSNHLNMKRSIEKSSKLQEKDTKWSNPTFYSHLKSNRLYSPLSVGLPKFLLGAEFSFLPKGLGPKRDQGGSNFIRFG